MNGIKIDISTPPALEGFKGKFETTGRVSVRSSCDTGGTEAHRFVFRRHFGHICGILEALREVNCTGSITCSIKNGEFQISGNLRVWFDGASDAVRQGLRYLNDAGWQAARMSADSRAEIHAVIIRNVVSVAA